MEVAMLSASRTTTRLLDCLRDPADEVIWTEFDARYRPIILAFARHLGLAQEDAADVAQETLASFLKAFRSGGYERTRGRLRSWIIGIARHRIGDLHRARGARREVVADTAIRALPDLDDTQELEVLWEGQRRAAMLRHALQELRSRTRTEEKTIRAFELVVFSGRSSQQAAAQLGMSVADVWTAKNRVAERLKRILDELEPLYDDRD